MFEPERAASAFLSVQLRALAARGHKSIASEGQKAPFYSACLVLVAAKRAPSAFLSIKNKKTGKMLVNLPVLSFRFGKSLA
ncbi:hypothetical protein BC6307_22120 [Sutcliffiella cohnii]|uniref:Uncharacterized protein n=1 Tax=Sutcliffiella cohnii TaxID=33932 RepID=A0A223KWJ0_9BACI|nr:hypothetical protein BC6307_22120 [Sutcliffiella cohnii]